jgi:hypothetical protein
MSVTKTMRIATPHPLSVPETKRTPLCVGSPVFEVYIEVRPLHCTFRVIETRAPLIGTQLLERALYRKPGSYTLHFRESVSELVVLCAAEVVILAAAIGSTVEVMCPRDPSWLLLQLVPNVTNKFAGDRAFLPLVTRTAVFGD